MIHVHGVGYHLLLAVAVQVAEHHVMRITRARRVQDVFLPRVIEIGAKLIPAEAPASLQLLADHDFLVPIVVDILKRHAHIEVAAGHDPSLGGRGPIPEERSVGGDNQFRFAVAVDIRGSRAAGLCGMCWSGVEDHQFPRVARTTGRDSGYRYFLRSRPALRLTYP